LGSTEIGRTVCLWCHSHCVIRVHSRDGRLVAVEGDQDHPRGEVFARTVAACPRARHAAEWFHHPDRLNHPLKRVGARGEGRFQRIGWEQALDDIASRLSGIRSTHGAEAVATTSGTYRTPDEYRRRFFYLFGSPNCISQGHICWGVSNMVSAALCGLSCNAVTPRPGKTGCIFLLGSNPAQAEVSSWRLILEAKRKGAVLIVVDPRRTQAAQAADLWLQVRPGTDGALLLAMLNVVAAENLADREFVTRWCHGYDALCERVKTCTPEWAEPITRIPAAAIRQAARMYATHGPCTSSSYLGVDQTSNCVSALHARYALMAITGNLDRVGADFGRPPTPLYVPESDVELWDRLPEEQKRKQLGSDAFPLLAWPGYDAVQEHVLSVHGRRMTSSHHCFGHAPSVFAAARTGKPYPVTAMLTAANNPLVTMPNARGVLEALRALDLYVVADTVMTPSAMMADYVLPAASFLERPSLFSGSDTAGFLTGGRAPMPGVVEGRYERRPDFDLWRGLGLRLGQEADWPWPDLEAAYDARLAPLGHTLRSFAEAGGHLSLRHGSVRWQDAGFATATGKFELYSLVFEKLGLDPLPSWSEPSESPLSTPALATDYPLILTTGGRVNVMYHSEHRQVEGLRRLHPAPLVQIHPDTACALGIADGDRVVIETPRGCIVQTCCVFDGVSPDVVHAEHGWWFPERGNGPEGIAGALESNVNVLTDDEPRSCNRASGGWPLRALLCRVRKA